MRAPSPRRSGLISPSGEGRPLERRRASHRRGRGRRACGSRSPPGQHAQPSCHARMSSGATRRQRRIGVLALEHIASGTRGDSPLAPLSLEVRQRAAGGSSASSERPGLSGPRDVGARDRMHLYAGQGKRPTLSGKRGPGPRRRSGGEAGSAGGNMSSRAAAHPLRAVAPQPRAVVEGGQISGRPFRGGASRRSACAARA